jgi:mRNA interferase RelE/StbE
MPFEVTFSHNAEGDPDFYRVFEQRLILEGIKQFLVQEPDVASNRRKNLFKNPLASWELRLGDFRVFL